MKLRSLLRKIQLKYENRQLTAVLLTSALVVLLWPLSAGKVMAAKPDGDSASNLLKARLELKSQGPFYIGDIIPVNLIVEGVSGTEYLLGEFESKQLDGLELAAQDKAKKEEVKGGWRHTIPYSFLGWRAGEYRVSGLTVNFQDRTGKKGSIQVKELQIKITSLLPANLSEEEILADGLKSLKKPVGLPPRYQYFWFLLAGLALLGLIYWSLQYWRSNYRNKTVTIMDQDLIKIEPAHLIALRRLDDLRRQQFLEDGEYKLFYHRLSEIAREYMENRFQIRALEMTTEEFLISLAKMDILNLTQKTAVTDFLQYSDLVKFAKYQPAREEGEKAFSIIHGLIEETKEEVEINDI